MSHAAAGVTVHVMPERRQHFNILFAASHAGVPFTSVMSAVRRAAACPLPIVAKGRYDIIVFCAAFRANVPVSAIISTGSRVFPVVMPVVYMLCR